VLQNNKLSIFCSVKLVKRRYEGGERYKERLLEDYKKKNPEFAAKLKLLEELKAKEKEENEKKQESTQ
jgi:hypothetical protein